MKKYTLRFLVGMAACLFLLNISASEVRAQEPATITDSEQPTGEKNEKPSETSDSVVNTPGTDHKGEATSEVSDSVADSS